MAEPLTFLENQLIRASLTTKTDTEISELIERTPEEVVELIKELIGPDEDNRSMIIEQHRRDAEQKKKVPIKKTEKKMEKVLPSPSRKKSYSANIETLRKERRRNDDRRKYATRQTDYSKMKRVKIDSRTTIMVAISVPDKTAIALYHANRKLYSRNILEEFK
jgi:hypothetical protein